MAEFQEVMRQYRRLCKSRGGDECAHKCKSCPIASMNNSTGISCDDVLWQESEIAESIIMKWAAEHPEPMYPTWVDWWNENFEGEGRQMLRPCSFVPPRELGCSIGHDGCMQAPYKCWHTPIPAYIAEKLGIKPIEED